MKRNSFFIILLIIVVFASILIRIPLKFIDVTFIIVISAVIIRSLFVLVVKKSFKTGILENLIVLAVVHLIILNAFKEIMYYHSASGYFIDAIKKYCYHNTVVEPAVFGLLAALSIIVFKSIYIRQYRLLAKHSLDSLPGRQMGIESDLSEKIITIDKAKILERELHQGVGFISAADGLGSCQLYSLVLVGGLYITALIYGQIVHAYAPANVPTEWISEFIQYITFYSFLGIVVIMITATKNLLISYNIVHGSSE